MQLSRSAWYKPLQDPLERDAEVIAALGELTKKHPLWGFRKCFKRLRKKKGCRWNHKRVRRVYRALGLNHKRRTKKRIPDRFRQPLDTPPIPNCVWAVDFMHDSLYVGRRFRTFNILDEGVREALHIEIDTSLPGERVVRALNGVTEWRGLPAAIRCDNGPELISGVLAEWCEEHDVELLFIEPGKPDQNGIVERFNRTYRNEVLNCYLFENLEQVREITHQWLIEYNEQRPHESLGDLTPVEFRTKIETETSTFEWST